MCHGSCASGVPTSIELVYMTDKAHPETGLERDLMQQITEVENHVNSLGAFLRCARYNPVDRFA